MSLKWSNNIKHKTTLTGIKNEYTLTIEGLFFFCGFHFFGHSSLTKWQKPKTYEYATLSAICHQTQWHIENCVCFLGERLVVGLTFFAYATNIKRYMQHVIEHDDMLPFAFVKCKAQTPKAHFFAFAFHRNRSDTSWLVVAFHFFGCLSLTKWQTPKHMTYVTLSATCHRTRWHVENCIRFLGKAVACWLDFFGLRDKH